MADKAAIIAHAIGASKDMKLVNCARKALSEVAGEYSWDSLNIKRFGFQGALSCFLDVVDGLDGPFDFDQIEDAITREAYGELPEVLQCPSQLEQNSLQFKVVRTGGNKYVVLRLLSPQTPQNAAAIRSMTKGMVFQSDWGSAIGRKDAKFAFHYIWSRLGGFQYVNQELVRPSEAPEGMQKKSSRERVLLSAEEIDAGYDLIKTAKDGMLDLSNNSLNRWIKKQQNDVTSPLFTWTKSEIVDGFKSLQLSADGAMVQTEYPLDIRDCDSWLAPVLTVLLPMLCSTSLILIGENSIGKTAFATILCMAFSRYWLGKKGNPFPASFRLTQDIDFLRNIPGFKEQPIIMDDGGIASWVAAVIKAFLDMRAAEASVRARWNRVSFPAGQLRIATKNIYDSDLGATVDASKEMTLQFFLDLIRPCFPWLSLPDMMAVLKRSSVMVNTAKHLIVKYAGRSEFQVLDIPEGAKYIKPDAISLLGAFSRDGTMRPDHQARIVDEQNFLCSLLEPESSVAQSSELASPCKRIRLKEELPSSPPRDTFGVLSVCSSHSELENELDDLIAAGCEAGCDVSPDLVVPALEIAEQISADDATDVIQNNFDERARELESMELEARNSFNAALAARGGN